MKEFKKTENGLFICEECGKTFKLTQGFGYHIKHTHKISSKEYYDKWLKEKDDDKCIQCKNLTTFYTISKGYHRFCSHKCSSNNLITRDKCKKTCNKRYNVDNVYQSEIIKNKCKQIKKKKYNNEYYLNRQKANETCLQHFGVKTPFQSKEFKEKRIQTCLKNNGVKYPMQSKKIQQKSKNTMLQKYNVEYAQQNIEIHIKQQKSAFKLKRFINTNIYYRSLYELDFLEKYYDKYPDIQNGPTIKYVFNKKNKIYFPDFYIPSLNLIIECKNSYLIKRDKEKIEAKENATIVNGFNYIMIIDKNYENLLI